MISFIHCGSEKGAYMFANGNNLVDAGNGGG